MGPTKSNPCLTPDRAPPAPSPQDSCDAQGRAKHTQRHGRSLNHKHVLRNPRGNAHWQGLGALPKRQRRRTPREHGRGTQADTAAHGVAGRQHSLAGHQTQTRHKQHYKFNATTASRPDPTRANAPRAPLQRRRPATVHSSTSGCTARQHHHQAAASHTFPLR